MSFRIAVSILHAAYGSLANTCITHLPHLSVVTPEVREWYVQLIDHGDKEHSVPNGEGSVCDPHDAYHETADLKIIEGGLEYWDHDGAEEGMGSEGG